MGFLGDWKFWLFTFTVINTVLTCAGFIIIKVNDFAHVQKNQKSLIKKVDNLSERVSFLEGKLDS